MFSQLINADKGISYPNLVKKNSEDHSNKCTACLGIKGDMENRPLIVKLERSLFIFNRSNRR